MKNKYGILIVLLAGCVNAFAQKNAPRNIGADRSAASGGKTIAVNDTLRRNPAMTTKTFSIAASVIIERKEEKELIPVPDTIFVEIPVTQLAINNIDIKPGYTTGGIRRDLGSLAVANRIYSINLNTPKILLNTSKISLPDFVAQRIESYRMGGTITVPPETTIHNLDYGKITCTRKPGAVMMSSDGECTSIGGATRFAANVSPALLHITGGRNKAYTLNFPKEVRLMCAGTKDMLMLDCLSPSTNIFELDSTGTQTIRFGGLLHTGDNQTPGEYKGEIRLEMRYYSEPIIICRPKMN
jgi:hypothetical protein